MVFYKAEPGSFTLCYSSSMTLLSVKNLTCKQSHRTLFDHATFSIEEHDKVAIIGTNGSGKTTLLKQVSQLHNSPIPEIVPRNGLRLSMLTQDNQVNPEHTILEHVFQSNTAESEVIRHYTQCLNNYNQNPSSVNEQALSTAMLAMDHANAWVYEQRIQSILTELEINDLSLKMKDLSGGMRKKVALAQVFFSQSDLLILDEPTNHLDIKTIEWLEGMLKKHTSAIMMVTHDRYFLDKVCTKIIEIDQQKIFVYSGNYQTYLEQREQRYLEQEKQESKIQSVLKTELAWLRQGPKARSTKQRARKDRISELLNRQTPMTLEAISLEVDHKRLGKKVLKLIDIEKSFGDKVVVKPFSHTFKQGERIGILGPNGVGKTTLLNLISQRLEPDNGTVDVGVNTQFGYFDQHSQDLDDSQSIYEAISQIGSQITYADGTVLSASKLLERFHFPSSMLKTKIGLLSGGERRRLHLVFLLLKNPNFLLFDEPTNDLDIQTLSVLEDFLLSFKGCLLIVSHDRYFMDRVVEQMLVFNNDSEVSLFVGNYTDYLDAVVLLESEKSKKKDLSLQTKSNQVDQKNGKQKLSYREKEELKNLEKNIDRLEKEISVINAFFQNGVGTPEEFEKAGRKLKDFEFQLEQSMQRWEELADRL